MNELRRYAEATVECAETLATGPATARARHCLTPRAAWWLAHALWAVASIQALFGLLLAALNRLPPIRFFAEYLVSQVAATLAFATVGALIASRRPRHAVGWLLCAAGVGSGLTAWDGQYARFVLVTRPGALPGGNLVAWLFFWTWIPVVAAIVIFLPLLFPDGRLPSARWRPLAWLAAIATGLLTILVALSPGPLDQSLSEVSNPFAPAWAEGALRAAGLVAPPLVLASLLGAVAAPIARFRRAQGVERLQLKWFALAATLLVGAFLTPPLVHGSDFMHEDTLLSGTLLAVALPLVAGAVGVAVLRYHLYDIDPIINRALVYGALTAATVGLYVSVVGYLGTTFQVGGNLLLSLVATGVVAVLFQPLRAWLQRGVNRMMYGDRDEPYAVIAGVGRRLEETLTPDAVLPTVVDTVRAALKLPYVAIAIEREGASSVAVETGTRAGEVVSLALVHRGAVVGRLLLSPRAPGEPLSPADRRLLDDLAPHAAAAVHGVWLTADLRRLSADLQASRERLVVAREEERRRLRRDLHDDLAPTLAALALTAATAGDLLDDDPATARSLVAELRGGLRATVGDVRRLAYDLRPPTLDELGLVAAIRERAASLDGRAPDTAGGDDPATALRVRVEAPATLPPLPAAVEVAAYRIAQEALINVTRHARAHSCTVRMTMDDPPAPLALVLAVEDDGIGLPPERTAGVGLTSMRERATELGGDCTIERQPAGGTRVRARLPLGEPPAGGREVERDEGRTLSHPSPSPSRP